MGEGAPGPGRAFRRRGRLMTQRPTTIAELEDWGASGAEWATVELDPRHVVLDLCSCTGERMERVESDDPEVIAFVQAHPDR